MMLSVLGDGGARRGKDLAALAGFAQIWPQLAEAAVAVLGGDGDPRGRLLGLDPAVKDGVQG